MTEEALQIKSTDEGIELSCPDYFDISLAGSLHIQLCQLFDEHGKSFVFDASQVEATDTAILQLVLAFTRDIRNRGDQIVWRNPSEAFCNAARFLGMEDRLGLEC